jgi:iron complex transport system ATP-binding protein
MIRTDGVSVTLGAQRPLIGVSLEGLRGHVTGIIGPNGSGKTTLVRVLAGVQPPDTGQVFLEGQPLTGFSPAARAKRIAYLPQNGSVAWSLRVRDVVALGRLPQSPHRWRSPLHHPTPQDQTAIAQALADTACTNLAERPYPSLSGGEKARALLARALATDAPVVLADEPVAALDPAQQVRILSVLQAQARSGRTVITVLHDLSLAARFCDHLVLLNAGRVAIAGPSLDVLASPVLESSFNTRFHRNLSGPVPVLVPTHPIEMNDDR